MTPPTLRRLVRVELRKMRDTRAGFWLLAVLGLLVLAVVALLAIFGKADELAFSTYLYSTQLPMGILLPVLGILAVTSEWSQRAALITFTLVPRRERIVAAKIVALVSLALLAVLASVAVAAAGNVISHLLRHADGTWGDVPSELGRVVLFAVISVLVGVGLGLLLLSAPQAIVAYLVAPTLLTVLASLVAVLRTPAPWLDLAGTTTRLLGEELTGRAWAQIAVSFGLWAALPLLFGTLRVGRREIQ